MAVLLIVVSALASVLAAASFGALLISQLRLPLFRQERGVIAFILGAGCMSLIVFAMCAAHIYYRGVILAVGLAAILFAWYRGALWNRETPAFGPLDKFERALLVLFVPFVVLYLANAIAPETSPDGSSYHLGIIAHYVRAHGFVPLHTTVYSSLSEGVELIYMVAFTFGRHSAGALVHLIFFSAAAWLMVCFGRRTGQTKAAIAASFLFYASPIAGVDGSSAYIDCATAAILFTVFYLLYVWRTIEESNGLLIAAGLLCGYAFAAKYTAGIIVLYALVLVVAKARRLRPALIVAACAIVLSAPWLLKNWHYTGNPLSPFFNRIFPNPYVHVQWEEDYKQYFKTYDMKDLRMIPWDATVTGNDLGGLLGPVFLLTPLALLGLRRADVRHLWLAGLVCLIPYPLNIGTRFLILALPFFALALTETIAMANVRVLLPVLMLAHGLLSWPRTPPGLLSLYAGATWRLVHVPFKQALRIEPEERYLARTQVGYLKARLIDKLVPRGEIVFSLSPVLDSYTTHEVAVFFQSAFGEDMADLLFTGQKTDRQAVRLMRFRIPPTSLQRIRVEQTATVGAGEQWAVSELRLFNGGHELPRDPAWRLTAVPNWWDVQSAFDNSRVTRWRTQQRARPGDYIEVDLPAPQTIDQVDVETSADNWMTRIRLLGAESPAASLKLLTDKIEELPIKPQPYARRMVTLEMAARGVHYLLIDPVDYGARDIFEDPEVWGLKELGQVGENGARLYHIEPLAPAKATQ
ncbi:MAG TPA: hypothetical protein VGL53_10000 [Bryobacteraceae bacterium]